jgi:hypothetical protein
MIQPVQYVAERIAQRYAHPSRTAYLYLFQIKADTDLTSPVPDPESVVAAWVDQGAGLASAPIELAVEQCAATYNLKLRMTRPRTPDERRRQMARCVMFTAAQSSEDTVNIHLVSRALAFSPKGDRVADEEWKPTGDGGWYSVYNPDRA